MKDEERELVASNVAAWTEFSSQYAVHCHASRTQIHYGLCIPGEEELGLLAGVACNRVLDVGSGTGENCLVLAKGGAQVVGVEPSPTLHASADALLATEPGVRLHMASWGNLDPSELGKFGGVLFIGSSDFFPLDESFFFLLNALTDVGSTTILSRIHPLWATLFRHETGDQSILSYFSAGRPDTVRYGSPPARFHRFFYGIAEILDRFASYGWRLDGFFEPAVVPSSEAPYYFTGCYEDPVLMERVSKVPMTLILKFTKLGAA